MKFRIGFGISLMALLILVSIAQLAVPVHAQTPDVAITQIYWGSDGDKLQPKPGDKAVPLTVETRVLSEEGLSSMLATLRLDGSPFSSIVGEKQAFAGVVGPISLGGSASVVFWLDIAEEAIPAEYKVFLNLDIKTPRFTSAVGISKEIPLPFHGKVDLSLQLAPKIVKPGSNVVELVVENLGQAKAKSVETTLSAPSSLTFLETDGRLVLGDIKPGEKTSTSFTVYAPNSAVGSPVLIAAAIEYFDPYGVQRTENRILGLAVGNGTVTLGGLEILRLAWGDPIVDTGVSPGDSNARLYVTIRNVSNNTITGVKGQLLLEDPFISLSGSEFVVADVAEINPSRTGVLGYTFDVSPQANPGTYTLSFSLDYLIRNDLSSPVTYIKAPTIAETLIAAVKGRTTLFVTALNHELTTDRAVEFPITIENRGEEAITQLKVNLELPTSTSQQAQLGSSALDSPIINIEGDNFWQFDLLKPDDVVTISPTLLASENRAGNFKLTLNLVYQEKSGEVKSETRNVGVAVTSNVVRPIIDVSDYLLSSPDVVQGQTFTVTFIIDNVGNENARAVSTELSTSQVVGTLGPNLHVLGDIKPAESRSVDYRLQASATAPAGSLQSILLKITFTDELGREKTVQTSLTIPIRGKVELNLFDTAVNPLPTVAGSNFLVAFTLVDTGTTPALFTKVSVIPDNVFIVSSASSLYLGELGIDEPVPVQLNAEVSPDVPEGTYDATIGVYYKDEFQNEHTQVFKVPVRVASIASLTTSATTDAEASSPISLVTNSLFLVVVPIVAIAAVSVFAYRRRKNREIE